MRDLLYNDTLPLLDRTSAKTKNYHISSNQRKYNFLEGNQSKYNRRRSMMLNFKYKLL